MPSSLFRGTPFVFSLKVRLLLRCAEAQDILLTRPQVPATPEGPLVRRAGEGRLPPAVLAAQGLAG